MLALSFSVQHELVVPDPRASRHPSASPQTPRRTSIVAGRRWRPSHPSLNGPPWLIASPQKTPSLSASAWRPSLLDARPSRPCLTVSASRRMVYAAVLKGTSLPARYRPGYTDAHARVPHRWDSYGRPLD